MKNVNSIIIFVASILIISCKEQYVVTSNFNRKPRIDKFKFKEFTAYNKDLCDSRSIYVDAVYPTHWLKFYPDGKVFSGNNESIPIDSNFVAGNGVAGYVRGYVGYYKVNGTELTMELFYTQQFNHWGYLVVSGIISGDTLRFYSDRYRGRLSKRSIHHFSNGILYIKSLTPHQLKKPDW
jgi:hypothetical protein